MQKVTIWSIQYLVHFVHSLRKAMDSKKASVTRDMPVVFRVDRWDCQKQMLCDRDSFAWLEFWNQSHFRFKMKNSSNYNLIPLFTVLLIIIIFFFSISLWAVLVDLYMLCVPLSAVYQRLEQADSNIIYMILHNASLKQRSDMIRKQLFTRNKRKSVVRLGGGWSHAK